MRRRYSYWKEGRLQDLLLTVACYYAGDFGFRQDIFLKKSGFTLVTNMTTESDSEIRSTVLERVRRSLRRYREKCLVFAGRPWRLKPKILFLSLSRRSPSFLSRTVLNWLILFSYNPQKDRESNRMSTSSSEPLLDRLEKNIEKYAEKQALAFLLPGADGGKIQKKLTYAQLDSEINSVRGLLHSKGIKQGDRYVPLCTVR